MTGRPRRSATHPIRSSVDLTPARHLALHQWQLDATLQLGRKVGRQEVLAGLVQLLLTDETVSRRLRAQLDEDG